MRDMVNNLYSKTQDNIDCTFKEKIVKIKIYLKELKAKREHVLDKYDKINEELAKLNEEIEDFYYFDDEE
jgi:hypothetical protein